MHQLQDSFLLQGYNKTTTSDGRLAAAPTAGCISTHRFGAWHPWPTANTCANSAQARNSAGSSADKRRELLCPPVSTTQLRNCDISSSSPCQRDSRTDELEHAHIDRQQDIAMLSAEPTTARSSTLPGAQRPAIGRHTTPRRLRERLAASS